MENSEKDIYYGIFTNGEVVKQNCILDLKNITNISRYIHAKYCYTYKGPTNISDWFQYIAINAENEPENISIDNFEIIYIDIDNGCTNFFGRKIQILDKSRNKLHSYISQKSGISFIDDEIIPLLIKLNELGSWESYELSLELEDLKLDHMKLKDKYDKLLLDNLELRKRMEGIDTIN